VADFVSRFFQHHQIEKRLFRWAQAKPLGPLDRMPVGQQERGGRFPPKLRQELLAALADGLRACVGVRQVERSRGVIERAQKAGNVPQGRRLAAALLKGAERLALEVDDIGIRLRDENLTEMEVSVDADREPAPAVLRESRQARREIGFARENGISERLAL